MRTFQSLTRVSKKSQCQKSRQLPVHKAENRARLPLICIKSVQAPTQASSNQRHRATRCWSTSAATASSKKRPLTLKQSLLCESQSRTPTCVKLKVPASSQHYVTQSCNAACSNRGSSKIRRGRWTGKAPTPFLIATIAFDS